MTLQQAYEVFFTSTNEKITEKNIYNKVTPADVKKKFRELMLKWHPDRYPNQSQMEASLRKMVSAEINSAMEIMNWALNASGKKSAPTYYEDLTILKLRKEEEEKERIRKQQEAAKREILVEKYMKNARYYLLKVDEVYNFRYKAIQEEFLRQAKGTNTRLLFCLPLTTTYQIINDFNITKDEFGRRIENLKIEYDKAKSEIKSEILSKQELENILKRFAKEFYRDLTNATKLNKLDDWFNMGGPHIIKEEINDNIAQINNLFSKIIARLTLAREIFENKKILLKLDILNQLLNDEFFIKRLSTNDLVNTANYEKKLKELSRAFEQIRLIDEEISQKYTEWQRLKEKYGKVSSKFLTIDMLVKIDEEISNLLPEDYRNLLNDFDKAAELGSIVKKKKPNITVQNQKVKAMVDDCRSHIISQMKENQEIIVGINNYIQNTNARLKYYGEDELEKMSDLELAQLSIDLKNEVFNLKQKAIRKYYEDCKYYYLSNGKINDAMVIEDTHDKYLAGGVTPLAVDNAYKYFKGVYAMWGLQDKKTDGSSISSKQNLISELQNLVFKIDPFSEILPAEVFEKYNERYTMDIDSLFELYKQIYNNYFKKTAGKKNLEDLQFPEEINYNETKHKK